MIPRLVTDKDTGKLCAQICEGKNAATITLPDDFMKWEEPRRENFLEMFVKEAAKNLKVRKPFRRWVR